MPNRFLGNRYLPLQLYDPNVSTLNAGDHPLDWQNVASSVGNKISYSGIDKIVTDEEYVTSLIIPLNDWGKMQIVGFNTSPLAETH